MNETIAQSYIQTAKIFGGLCTDPRLLAEDSAVPLTLWQDQLSRLKLWSANIGAHQTGQSSLDFRLRNAEHVHLRVLSLLKSLRSSLDDLTQLIAPGEAVETEIEEMTISERRDELRDIYILVKSMVECLFQLSMSIRVPGKRQRIRSGKDHDHPSVLPGLDLRRLQDKFPQATPNLCQRLATATARRRAALEGFKTHKSKLAHGIDDHSDGQTVQSSTVATSYHPDDREAEEGASEAGNSETSFAASIFGSETHRSVPAPPEGALDGEPFECPYCYFIVEVRSTAGWARHLFQDLMPYICVFDGCNIPGRLYDKRRDWFVHNRENHSPQLAEGKCPLCPEGLAAAQLTRHVARHLQDVALFVLPTHDSVNTITEESWASDSDSDSMGVQEPTTTVDASPPQLPGHGSEIGEETRIREAQHEPKLRTSEDNSRLPEVTGPRIQALGGGGPELEENPKVLGDQDSSAEDDTSVAAEELQLEEMTTGGDKPEDIIPPNARWTKVSRVLVNAEALERSGERFEEREDSVIILRVVPKSEIQALADLTREIRLERRSQSRGRSPHGESSDVEDLPRQHERPKQPQNDNLLGWWKCHRCGYLNNPRSTPSICLMCRHLCCALCSKYERRDDGSPTRREPTISMAHPEGTIRSNEDQGDPSGAGPVAADSSPARTDQRTRGLANAGGATPDRLADPLLYTQFVTPGEVFQADFSAPVPASQHSTASRPRRQSRRESDMAHSRDEVHDILRRSLSAEKISVRDSQSKTGTFTREPVPAVDTLRLSAASTSQNLEKSNPGPSSSTADSEAVLSSDDEVDHTITASNSRVESSYRRPSYLKESFFKE